MFQPIFNWESRHIGGRRPQDLRLRFRSPKFSFFVLAGHLDNPWLVDYFSISLTSFNNSNDPALIPLQSLHVFAKGGSLLPWHDNQEAPRHLRTETLGKTPWLTLLFL